MSLKQRISLIEKPTKWLNEMSAVHHYMHRPIHARSCPFGWAIEFDGQLFQPDGKPSGFIVFATIHYLGLKGEFGYDSVGLNNGSVLWQEELIQSESKEVVPLLESWAALHPEVDVIHEERPTKWQTLSLSRLWLHDNLPRNSETCVMGKAFKLVQRRWLEVHPPPFPEQPYHILKIISYADTRYHRGTIYKAANFRESGRAVSRKRHKNSRGPGIGKGELIRFIYDLKHPNWDYEPEESASAKHKS